MVDDTINDENTVVGGGKDVILAGRYHILRLLNEGGMDSVGLAEDRQIATQSYERLLSGANPDRRRKRKELPLTPLPDKPKSLVPADFIKNPMLLEFLSLPAEVKLRETKRKLSSAKKNGKTKRRKGASSHD